MHATTTTAVALLLALLTASARAENARPLRLVQWNVENLFDTQDDPANEGDDEYSPRGWERWTDALYGQKLTNLAAVLGPLDADFICLEEVENRRVLEDLCTVLRERFGRDYPYILHREGTDHRGIDVAMISRLQPTATNWITPVADQRDILIAEFERSGLPLTVLVNHWKSHLGSRDETDGIRMQQAQAAYGEVTRRLASDPGRAILVTGDFNDDFDSPTLTKGLRSIGDRARVLAGDGGPWLFNLASELPVNRRGTLYFKKGHRWNSFDSVSVSRELLGAPGDTNGGWRVKAGSYQVIQKPEMRGEQGAPKPFRREREAGTNRWEYVTGYADHFPVTVVLEQAPAN